MSHDLEVARRLLHVAVAESAHRIDSLTAVLSGHSQSLQNLEGTVTNLSTGLTSLTAGVADLARELNAFMATNQQKPAEEASIAAARKGDRDHSPSRQRSPRRQAGDAAESDSGTH